MKLINCRKFTRGTFFLFMVILILTVFGMGNTRADWIIEPTKAGFVSVKGGRIWYRMNGNEHFAKGKTPLIVIHGGPGFSHHYLLPLVDLADERPVILYDQLDSGHSDRPNSPVNWKLERFISEIDALREALGLDRVFVFGNS